MTKRRQPPARPPPLLASASALASSSILGLAAALALAASSSFLPASPLQRRVAVLDGLGERIDDRGHLVFETSAASAFSPLAEIEAPESFT